MKLLVSVINSKKFSNNFLTFILLFVSYND